MKIRYDPHRYPHLIRLYRNEIGGYKRLKPEQEREIADRVQRNKDRHARDLLALSNWKLATYFASRFQHHGVEYLDLVQVGNEVLLGIAEIYDGSTQFSTYATWRVRGSIVDEVRRYANTVRMARWRIDEWKRINKARRALSQQLGRDAHDWEIAEKLNLSTKRVRVILNQQLTPMHFEDPIGHEQEQTIADTWIGAEKELGPEEILDAKEELESTVQVLRDARDFSLSHQAVSSRDGRIFCTYFGLLNGLELDTPYRVIADQEDLTEGRVSQICTTVLDLFSTYTPHSAYSRKEFCNVIYKVHRLENLIGEEVRL